jgi:hypothetical protein
LRIGVTEAAVAAQGRLALLNGGEPTILAAEAGIIRTPRIILRLRVRADADGHGENCQHEKYDSHGRSPRVAMLLNYKRRDSNIIAVATQRISVLHPLRLHNARIGERANIGTRKSL